MKWHTVQLSDIALIIMGQSPPSSSYNENGDGVPLFQGKGEFGDIHPIPIKWCTEPTRIAEPGDILMSVRTPVGPTNIANQRCCIGRGLAAIRANNKLVEQKYLYFLFKNIEPSITLKGQGSTFQAINRADIEFLKISLPPITEQRYIVKILDQADALQKKRAEADAKAECILSALFIKMFGNPSDWTLSNSTKTLGSLINIQSGSTPSKQNSDYWNGEIAWVSAKDMKRDIIFDSIDHISHLAIEETNIKYVEPGAILIVVRGMILAHTIPIALAGSRLTINQDMKALQPNCNNINSDYLYAALKASSRRRLLQVGTAAHGTRKIDTNELLKLPILIPSKENLEKFSNQIKECRLILARISETKERLEKLFDTLLKRAFSGELTAKWREVHMKQLLTEMEEQRKALNTPVTDFKELPLFRDSNKQMIEGHSYD